MKPIAGALLVFVNLLGCQPGLIDALSAPPGDMDGSSPEAATGDAQPQGGPAGASALAYYSFDEGTGSIVHDSSPHGYEGTLVGAAWTDAGRFGGAIAFSAAPDGGVDDWILVNPFPQPGSPEAPSYDWSVSFWLLAQSEDFAGGYVSVLSTEIAMQGGWEVDILPPTTSSDPTFAQLQFAYWVPSAYTYATGTCTCLEFGQWTHFVAVVDSSALTVQIFQDNQSQKTSPAHGQFVPGLSHLYMGRWGGSTERQLAGVLDEVAIYNRKLTTEEVGELYAGVVP